MRTKCGAWFVVVLLAGWTSVSAAGQSAGTILQSVQAVGEGGGTLVTIQANGPLPVPTFDAVDGPPRIFLDFADVMPKVNGTSEGSTAGVVKRARVGVNSVSPRITRVVLDLTRRETYRVDTDERHLGRIRILVGSEPGPPAVASAAPARIPSPAPAGVSPPASANPVPPPAVPAQPAGVPPPAVPNSLTTFRAETRLDPRVPAPTATTPPPATTAAPATPPPLRPARKPQLSPPVSERPSIPAPEILNYRQQLGGALERMEARRPLAASIDADEDVSAEALAFTAQEFKDLRRILEALKPTGAIKPTHDLLIASCTLGTQAASLRIDAARENSPQIRRNAASAAAGYLMLFDLACADLQCAGAPR